MSAAVPLAAVLLLGGLAAPAAEEPPAGPLLTDDRGDVVLSTPASDVPVSGAEADALDLLSLAISESDDTLAFILSVATLDGRLGVEYASYFAWRGVEYRVWAASSKDATGQEVYRRAYLDRLDSGDFERVSRLDFSFEASPATLTILLPKHLILDAEDRALIAGESLDGLRVVAQRCCFTSLDGKPTRFVDEMTGGGGVSLPIVKGDVASGSLALAAEDRIRVSNGEATTFLFQVDVTNSAPTEAEVALGVADVPEGWNATVPSPLRIKAGEEKTATVVVSVPFEHEHGGFVGFNVTAASRSDPASFARLRLGVLHTPIPQPAGHHNELFLHTRNSQMGFFGTLASHVWPFNGGSMNTVPDREEDEPATMTQNGCMDDFCGWWIPLSPSLQMGLDFDVLQTGSLVGSIVGKRIEEAEVRAKLLLYREDDGGGEETVLAEAAPAPIQLDLQNPAPFSLVLEPTEDSDYVPYAPNQNVYLFLGVSEGDLQVGCCGRQSPDLVAAGFKLTLPLLEYHDEITSPEATGPVLSLLAEGPLEKAGKPGNIVTYAFTLTNGGSGDVDVKLDLAGGHSELAVLVPDSEIRLGPRESRKLTLAVEIPVESAEGHELEVLVFAHSKEDPTNMAIARTRTTASYGEDAVPDESEVLLAAQSEERRTPGPGPWALLLGAAALAWSAGRRRR